MEYYDLPPKGMVLTFACRAGHELRILVIDYSYGLPDSAELAVAPRPPGVLPGGVGDADLGDRHSRQSVQGGHHGPQSAGRQLRRVDSQRQRRAV